MNTLGESIRHAREKAGIGQKALADFLKVQPQTVWRWEKGEREPSWEMLQNIATCLNAPDLTGFISDLGSPRSEIELAEKNETVPSLAYWGSVVDNARKAVARANRDEIGDIRLLLTRALEPVDKAYQDFYFGPQGVVVEPSE